MSIKTYIKCTVQLRHALGTNEFLCRSVPDIIMFRSLFWFLRLYLWVLVVGNNLKHGWSGSLCIFWSSLLVASSLLPLSEGSEGFPPGSFISSSFKRGNLCVFYEGNWWLALCRRTALTELWIFKFHGMFHVRNKYKHCKCTFFFTIH